MTALSDPHFFSDVGLDCLGESDRKSLLEACQAELELRVGTILIERFSEPELAEFDALMNTDRDRASDWLGDRVPERADIVKQQAALIREEVRERAPEIIAATCAEEL